MNARHAFLAQKRNEAISHATMCLAASLGPGMTTKVRSGIPHTLADARLYISSHAQRARVDMAVPHIIPLLKQLTRTYTLV